MEQVDSLSRRADWVEGVERDNKSQVMLKKIKVVKEIKKTEVKVLKNNK